MEETQLHYYDMYFNKHDVNLSCSNNELAMHLNEAIAAEDYFLEKKDDIYTNEEECNDLEYYHKCNRQNSYIIDLIHDKLRKKGNSIIIKRDKKPYYPIIEVENNKTSEKIVSCIDKLSMSAVPFTPTKLEDIQESGTSVYVSTEEILLEDKA